MATELSSFTVDRNAFSIVSLDEDTDEVRYWLTCTAQERLHHMQRLRQINYGYRSAERLQRVLEVVELAPVHVLLIDINEYHQHIDFIFYAKAETDQVEPGIGESNLLRWYSRDEILHAKLPENVRILASEALDLLADDK